MIKIERKYRFYAAHRNENLTGTKCSNLHGHTYNVTAVFKFSDALLSNGVTMEFEAIDKKVEPIIKEYDHTLLINTLDPLFKFLKQYNQSVLPNEEITFKTFAGQTTSAENVATRLFRSIASTGLPIVEIRLQETESSNVIYKVHGIKETGNS